MSYKSNSGTDSGRYEHAAEKLFKRYSTGKSADVREQLIVMHQNLVRYLASKFLNRGEPLDDLLQVGMIGLINAIERFDPNRGIQFSTYATPTVVGEIRRHFRDKAWSIKVPRRLQELNIAASRAQDALASTLGRSPTIVEVAHAIHATEEETLEAIELGNAYDPISLDSQVPGDQDSAAMTLGECIGAEDATIANFAAHGDLVHAISHLDPRECMIIIYRYFQDMSQADIAQKLHISQMHVSRLQTHALRSLKRTLSEEAA